MNYRERAERHSDPRYARILDLIKPRRAPEVPVVVVQAASVPDVDADSELKTLRADYLDLVGKRPFHGWDADELRVRINSALTAAPDVE